MKRDNQNKNPSFKVISENRFPRWLKQRIGDSKYDAMYLPISDLRFELDHFQTRKVKSRIEHKGYTEGKPDTEEIIYISQPYDPLTFRRIKHMIEVCEKHGIEFDIRGDSDHYPGRTVMIEWRKKKV